MKKPGTPNFVPERLKQAREARLLTGVALADLVGITSASITQYERGKQTPSPEMLQKLATELNVQPSFFTTPMPEEEAASAIFWRSTASTTVFQRRRAKSRYDWLREIVAWLRGFLKLPAVKFPGAVVSPDPSLLTWEEIELLATEARRYWGLGDGAISNLTLLLENNGTIVAHEDLVAPTLDAFSQWRWESNVPYVFLGSAKGSAARHRFNVAHELGHLLLHRYVPQVRIGRMEQHNLVEAQANRFAAAFLLPAEAFQADLYTPTLDAMLALKPQLNVSVGMMIHRVSDLGMASDDHVKRLWMNYARRKWRLREPLDGDVPVEEPRLLRRALEMLVDTGIQTKAQIRGRFKINTRDIEDLIGLKVGYLTDDLQKLHLVDSDRGEPHSEDPGAGDGKVIPFADYRRRRA